jgi:hypothetical protein
MTAGRAEQAGHLTVPPDATGVAVVAHGERSSPRSPLTRQVADALQQGGPRPVDIER